MIELLVVIAIIAILSVGAIAAYSSAQGKARDSVRLADLGVLNGQTAVYFSDNSAYPPNNTKAAYTAALVPAYMQAVPNAQGTNPYIYGTKLVGTGDGTGLITAYEYAVALESSTNTAKATNDGGNSTQYEIGTDLTIINAAGTGTGAAADDHGMSWNNTGVAVVGDTGL